MRKAMVPLTVILSVMTILLAAVWNAVCPGHKGAGDPVDSSVGI